MKKFLIVIIILLIINIDFAFAEFNSSVAIKKGVFIKVFSPTTISTNFNDEGDQVFFLNMANYYAGENIAIPKDSVFKGYVETIYEAYQGVNASMRIKITSVVYPNGEEHPIDAYVWTKDKEFFIGGGLSGCAEYKTVPHYSVSRHDQGVLQWVPLKYKFGAPAEIKASSELLLILMEDFYLYF